VRGGEEELYETKQEYVVGRRGLRWLEGVKVIDIKRVEDKRQQGEGG
jgi:hypothetical protein